MCLCMIRGMWLVNLESGEFMKKYIKKIRWLKKVSFSSSSAAVMISDVPLNSRVFFSGCSVLNRLFNLWQFHYVAYLFNRVCFSTGKSVKKCDGCRWAVSICGTNRAIKDFGGTPIPTSTHTTLEWSPLGFIVTRRYAAYKFWDAEACGINYWFRFKAFCPITGMRRILT